MLKIGGNKKALKSAFLLIQNYFFLVGVGVVLSGETVTVIFEAMLSAEPSATSTVTDFFAFVKTIMLFLDLVDDNKVQPACG